MIQKIFGLNGRSDFRPVFVTLVCLFLTTAVLANDYTLVMFDVDIPGSRNTRAFGINARGDVVGMYQIQTPKGWRGRGFLYKDGVFETIYYSGARGTQARGINERGDIVGFFREDFPNSPRHAFLLRDSVWTIIDVPGAIQTWAFDISATGVVTGDYQDQNGERHAFSWDDGEFTYIDVPGFVATAGHGINAQGEIVGHFRDKLTPDFKEWGYIRSSQGDFTTIDYEKPNKMTCAWDINPRGDVVGHYILLNDPIWYGFVMRKGEFTTIAVPGAVETLPWAINPSGLIAGFAWYFDPNASPNWSARSFFAIPLNPAGKPKKNK